MTKMGESYFPLTITNAVVDETTGKTLDVLLSELEDHTHNTYTTPNEVRDIVENVIDEALSVVINTPL